MSWGNGKGWQNKNNWNCNQAPYDGGRGRRWFNNFENFGNDGFGGNVDNGPLDSLANQSTNMVGEPDAFGKMARIGQALVTATETTTGTTQASAGISGAVANVANLAAGSTPSVSQSSQNFATLANRLGSVLSNDPTPNMFSGRSGLLPDNPTERRNIDELPENHTSSAYDLDVENDSRPLVIEDTKIEWASEPHPEWSVFHQLVDDALVEQEFTDAKRLGQELALESEDEKERKEQAELDEILTQEAQTVRDAIFFEVNMVDP